jgi:hypothetical protein
MNTEFKIKVSELFLKRIDTTYQKGSCGELGKSVKTIDYDYLNDIVNEIGMIVNNDFEPKKCIPDGVNSKEEYEEYLKAIGYEKYVKYLEHFKENHVGLYVIDKMIDDIFTDTPEEKDCKTVVEAYLVQQFKRLKSLMWQIS